MKFEREKCELCGECLANCLYLGYDLERAKAEIIKLYQGEASEVLERCITCFGCEEYCPNQAHPFDLILEGMAKHNRKPVSPEMIQMMEARYHSDRAYQPPEISELVIDGCVFYKTHPHLFQGPLFEGATILRGRPVFCYVLFLHLGNREVLETRAPQVIANLEKTKAREIIFFHDDCYALVHNFAPRMGLKMSFSALHILEYIRRWLEENRERIQRLNLKIAYQRPCASRYSPEKDKELERIFELVGVERVKRKYDRERALCCGGAFLARGNPPREIQLRNLEDALEAGAKELVCLCPVCMDMLSSPAQELGFKLTHIIELVNQAIGFEI